MGLLVYGEYIFPDHPVSDITAFTVSSLWVEYFLSENFVKVDVVVQKLLPLFLQITAVLSFKDLNPTFSHSESF